MFVSRPLFVTNVFKNSSSDLKKSNTEKLILLLLLSSFSSSSSSRNTQKKSSFFDGVCRNVLGPLFVFFCNFCKFRIIFGLLFCHFAQNSKHTKIFHFVSSSLIFLHCYYLLQQ